MVRFTQCRQMATVSTVQTSTCDHTWRTQTRRATTGVASMEQLLRQTSKGRFPSRARTSFFAEAPVGVLLSIIPDCRPCIDKNVLSRLDKDMHQCHFRQGHSGIPIKELVLISTSSTRHYIIGAFVVVHLSTPLKELTGYAADSQWRSARLSCVRLLRHQSNFPVPHEPPRRSTLVAACWRLSLKFSRTQQLASLHVSMTLLLYCSKYTAILQLIIGWRFGLAVTRWSLSTSYSTPGPVNTWMGDCLRAGTLSRYVTKSPRSTQPSILPE